MEGYLAFFGGVGLALAIITMFVTSFLAGRRARNLIKPAKAARRAGL
jgi:hypothetical protein